MARRGLRAVTLAGLLSALAVTLAFGHGISAAARQRMLESGYLQYAVLGAEHMLTGYDHLLFLLGVVFFLTNVRDVVKFVTAFTVPSSIRRRMSFSIAIPGNGSGVFHEADRRFKNGSSRSRRPSCRR